MTKLSKILSISTISAACACGGSNLEADEPTEAPCPPSLPEGCQMVVLAGNPAQAGTYTMRIKTLGAFVVPPHSHPKAARITVIDGTMNIGFGEVLDKTKSEAMSTGDFYINPADAPHFVWADGPVTLQVTGEGPRSSVPVGEGHQH